MSDEVMDIPVDWDVTTLGEVNTLRSRTLVPGSFPDEVFEYYSIPDYQNGERPGRVAGKTIASAKLQLKPKSVLFGKLNPRVEKVWRVGPLDGLRQIGSTEWIPVLPDERMDPDFLYFLEWSDHVMPKAKTLVSGSTPSRQRVDPTSFYKIQIPLPPLPEQQRIAQVLSTVQEAIAQQERLIRTTTELKQALMQKLFTEGLRGEALKETEIGRVPESWEVVKIGDVTTIRSSSMSYSELDGSASVEDGVSVMGVKVSDMNLSGNEKEFLTANLQRNLPSAIASRKAVPAGTVVFPKRGAAIATNKKRIATCPTVLDPNLIGVAPTEVVNSRYLYHWFDTFDLRTITDPGPTPQLNKKDITPLSLPLPSMVEQVELATTIDTIDQKLTNIAAKRNTLQDLFRTLLHELMTGKVRVGHIN